MNQSAESGGFGDGLENCEAKLHSQSFKRRWRISPWGDFLLGAMLDLGAMLPGFESVSLLLLLLLVIN